MPTDPADPHEQLDTLEHGGGAEPGSRSLRRRGLTALAAALALVAAGAVGASLGGGSEGSSGAPAAGAGSEAAGTEYGSQNSQPLTGGDGAIVRERRSGGLDDAVAKALHLKLVVPDPAGGYRTLVVHKGTATRVAASSITVTSADGFSSTYAVTAATKVCEAASVSDIAAGADVEVLAVKADRGVRALHVTNRSRAVPSALPAR